MKRVEYIILLSNGVGQCIDISHIKATTRNNAIKKYLKTHELKELSLLQIATFKEL